MPIPLFRCCKCKKVHDSRSDAVACEKSHLAVAKAKAKQYTIGPYPFMLEVTFKDGVTKDYIADAMH